MKRIVHILFILSAFLGSLAAAVSCTKEDGTPQEQKVLIQINLDAEKATKATPTEHEK